jgi:hypothetical protein
MDVTAREQMHNTLAEMNEAQLNILAQVGGWQSCEQECCDIRRPKLCPSAAYSLHCLLTCICEESRVQFPLISLQLLLLHRRAAVVPFSQPYQPLVIVFNKM